MTDKELSRILEYYCANPTIYEYCYENSPEFKFFIDNANDELKENFKKMQKAYRASHCRDGLTHIGTFGLSLVGKKISQNNELKRVAEKIETEEFKEFFKNLGELLKKSN